jgi:segregation and condensation protein B
MLSRKRYGSELRRDPTRLGVDTPPRRRWRLPNADFGSAPTAADRREAAMACVEAALFAAEEPLTPRALTAIAELKSTVDTQKTIAALQATYSSEGGAFQVVELAGGYQLFTRPEFYPWLARLRQAGGESRLTAALLETLAIVAYRQPIMRADLETIRGVDCRETLHDLMTRGLIRIAGRDDSLGRPILYATTKRFLQVFGLRDLVELPPLETRKN